MNTEFIAKVIDSEKYYSQRQFFFFAYTIGHSLLIGSIGGTFISTISSGDNYLLLSMLVAGYILIAIPLYKNMRNTAQMRQSADELQMRSERLLVFNREGEKVRDLSIEKGQKMRIQIRSERIGPYFNSDYKDRAANYIRIGDERIDFIVESDYRLRQLLELAGHWHLKGVEIELDLEKSYKDHNRKLPVSLQK
jgi:hypothetical protein